MQRGPGPGMMPLRHPHESLAVRRWNGFQAVENVMPHSRTRDPAFCRPDAPEGGLKVLRRDFADRGPVVSLQNRRRIDVRALMIGRAASGAAGVLRQVYPHTGTVQGLACLTALELALDRPADPDTLRARALFAQAEMAVAMIQRACTVWPRMLGEQPQLPLLRYANAAMQALGARLWRGGDPLEGSASAAPLSQAEPAISALIEAIETAVLPRAPADPGALADWASRNNAPMARLIRRAARVPLLHRVARANPLPDLPVLSTHLTCDPAGAAVHGGLAFDPTPYARQAHDPGAARFGPLGARFLAQAAQAQALVEALTRLDPPPLATCRSGQGAGVALVEGLGGPFVQCASCDRDGRITRYSSRMPADWILHPDGALTAMLAALKPERVLRDAPMVLAGFDAGGSAVVRHARLDAAADSRPEGA